MLVLCSIILIAGTISFVSLLAMSTVTCNVDDEIYDAPLCSAQFKRATRVGMMSIHGL